MSFPCMTPDEQKSIVDMAAGRIPVDLRVDNARIVDVFSREVIHGSLAVGNGRIVGIGDYAARDILDAKGSFIIPGLIDGHVHIESSLVAPPEFARAVLPHGVTTVIADPHEIANVRGLEGIGYMLESSRDLPLDVYIMLPSCVPATDGEHAGAILLSRDLATLIDHPFVGGIGEMMNYPAVAGGDAEVLAKIMLGLSRGKVVDGHSPAVGGLDLNAYAAAGVMTDHECSTVKEMHDRIARGMYVLMREGSAARDLQHLIPGVTEANSRRCVFCTDDRQPADLLTNGSIDNNIRIAVSMGVDPVLAVTMATLNAAECYGLRSKGALAPGRDADFLLVDDLRHFEARAVYAKGVLVAEGGGMIASLPTPDNSAVLNTVNIKPLSENPLSLMVPEGRANVIGIQPHSLVTKALVRDVVTDGTGQFSCARNPDLLKLAVVERHKATGNIGVGLLENYGLRHGAVATTVAHDSHNIVVCGDNDHDMLVAIHDIEAMGGGITLVRDGNVVAHLPLALGGLMSESDAEHVAKELKSMNTMARDEFSINPDLEPFMTLSFMTLPVIPELKLTDSGLFDVRSFSLVEVSAT